MWVSGVFTADTVHRVVSDDESDRSHAGSGDDQPLRGDPRAAAGDERSGSNDQPTDSDTPDDQRTASDPSNDQPTDSDPSIVEVIVIHESDLLTALEARLRGRERTILRITPPFSARMRARLHVARVNPTGDDPQPIRLDPRALVSDPPDPTTTERATWRRLTREKIRDSVEISTESGLTTPRVVTFGS